jgi:hypothetical protein
MAQRRPVISPQELAYEVDPEQPLRAFEGTLEYKEFPAVPVRTIIRFVQGGDGKLTDIQSIAVFYSTASDDVFCVPAVSGGSCRARVEGPDAFLVQTGTLDFRWALSTQDGEGVLQGTAVDPSTTAVVGTCHLREVIAISALSRKWLRFGPALSTSSEESLSVAQPLPSAEALQLAGEEIDKFYSRVAGVVKSTLAVLETSLKATVTTQHKLLGTTLAAALTSSIASVPFPERQSIVAAAQALSKSAHSTELPDPQSNAVIASCLGTSEEDVCHWLLKQRTKGLPQGQAAEWDANRIRLFAQSAAENSIAVLDDGALLRNWFKKSDLFLCVSVAEGLPSQPPSGSKVVVLTDWNSSNAATVLAAATTGGWANRKKILYFEEAGPIVGTAAMPRISHLVSVPFYASYVVGQLASPAPETPAGKLVSDGVEKAQVAALELSELTHQLLQFCEDQSAAVEQQSGDFALAYVAFSETRIHSLLESFKKVSTQKTESEQYVRPSAKQAREVEVQLPLAQRVSIFTLETFNLLNKMECRLAFQTLRSLSDTALAIPAKQNQTPIEAFSKNFVQAIVQILEEDDRLPFCAALGMKLMVYNNQIPAGALVTLLSAFRRSDVANQLEFEARKEQENADARSAWEDRQRELAQEAAAAAAAGKAPKKGTTNAPNAASTQPKAAPKEKEFVSKLVPEVRPKYNFLSIAQWVRLLALSQTRAPFSNLLLNIHEAESGAKAGTASKEGKWRDWFAAPSGPIPFYEKDTNITPFDRLALIHAVRPDRTVVALLQFVQDVFGSDFVDPFSPTDVADVIKSLHQQAPEGEPIVLFQKPNDAENDILVDIAAAMQSIYVAKLKSEGKSDDTQAKKKSDRSVSQAVAVAPLTLIPLDVHDYSVGGLCEAVSNSQGPSGSWIAVLNAHSLSSSQLKEFLDSIQKLDSSTRVLLIAHNTVNSPLMTHLQTSTNRRVTVSHASGVQATMSRHYGALGGDALRAMERGPIWSSMLFVVSYLSALIEQRQRYYEVGGFQTISQALQSDADLKAAVTAMVRYSNSSEVPWDDVRELLSCLIADVADKQDQAVIKAYIDWLVHPDIVVEGGGTALGASLVPKEMTLAAHRSAIDAIAQIDSADVVGMHSNTERILQERSAARLINRLELLTGTGTDDNMFRVVQQRAKDLLGSLPYWATNDLAMLQSEAPESALGEFLYEEVQSLAQLVNNVSRSLKLVVDARSLSEADEEVVSAIWAARVPRSWTTEASSLAWSSWIEVIKQQHQQLVQWAHKGRPALISFPLIRNPKKLLAAFTIDACSKKGLFIECFAPALKIPTMEDAQAGLDTTKLEGLLLTGISLEGAQLNSDRMLTEAPDLYASWWQPGEFAVEAVYLTLAPANRGKTPKKAASPATPSSPLKAARHQVALEFSRNNMVFTKTRPSSASGAKPAPIQPVIPQSDSSSSLGSSRSPTDLGLSQTTNFSNAAPSPLGGDAGKATRPATGKKRAEPPTTTFFAPLYSGSRTASQFVAYVEVPTQMEPNHWVLRGAAMVGHV